MACPYYRTAATAIYEINLPMRVKTFLVAVVDRTFRDLR